MSWIITGLGKDVVIDDQHKIVRIGRDERCNFAFPKDSEGVSRVHAVVSLGENKCANLEDKSTYGTEFRGDSICKRKVTLANGDKFSIQGQEFAVRLVDEVVMNSSSRNPKRVSDAVDDGGAKRLKVSSNSSQKKVSDFFVPPSRKVIAEDTPVELLRKPHQRTIGHNSVVLETIVTIHDDDAPSLSRNTQSIAKRKQQIHLLDGLEQSSAGLFGSRPILAADSVNHSFNLNDVNSQMSFNPIANSTQLFESREVVPLSPESDVSVENFSISQGRAYRKNPNSFLVPSLVPIPQSNIKAKRKTSIFASTATQNISTAIPSVGVVEANDNLSNAVPKADVLKKPRSEISATVNTIPSVNQKKTSIFSKTSDTTVRDIKPAMTSGLTGLAHVKSESDNYVDGLRNLNSSVKNTSAASIKQSESSGENANGLRELASMICTQYVDDEDTPGIAEEKTSTQFNKVLKNMEKLVVFADLTRSNLEISHSSGLSSNNATGSTLGTTTNFKKFRKARQGKFNPALVTMSSSMRSATDELVDFRKFR